MGFYDGCEEGNFLISWVSSGLVGIISWVGHVSVVLISNMWPMWALCFRYNIQYGRISAPDNDIVFAAKHADIHDRILTFPEAYETKVCPCASDYAV